MKPSAPATVLNVINSTNTWAARSIVGAQRESRDHIARKRPLRMNQMRKPMAPTRSRVNSSCSRNGCEDRKARELVDGVEDADRPQRWIRRRIDQAAQHAQVREQRREPDHVADQQRHIGQEPAGGDECHHRRCRYRHLEHAGAARHALVFLDQAGDAATRPVEVDGEQKERGDLQQHARQMLAEILAGESELFARRLDRGGDRRPQPRGRIRAPDRPAVGDQHTAEALTTNVAELAQRGARRGGLRHHRVLHLQRLLASLLDRLAARGETRQHGVDALAHRGRRVLCARQIARRLPDPAQLVEPAELLVERRGPLGEHVAPFVELRAKLPPLLGQVVDVAQRRAAGQQPVRGGGPVVHLGADPRQCGGDRLSVAGGLPALLHLRQIDAELVALGSDVGERNGCDRRRHLRRHRRGIGATRRPGQDQHRQQGGGEPATHRHAPSADGERFHHIRDGPKVQTETSDNCCSRRVRRQGSGNFSKQRPRRSP
jgi:hypothetical protein